MESTSKVRGFGHEAHTVFVGAATNALTDSLSPDMVLGDVSSPGFDAFHQLQKMFSAALAAAKGFPGLADITATRS
jgi:hypothetical protein